uniref:Uncharacterized protein n=1 Tax=Solanum lycopersicum TaxID=4081 RepID=A0A3Q7FUI2_SOLLC
MACSDQNSVKKSKSHANSTSIFSQARRKMSFRWKKLSVVQQEAGGKKKFLISRRDGLKGKNLHYLSMKKIKECYWLAVNEILEASDTFDQRLVSNTSFALPMMGLPFATFPNRLGI